MYLGQRVREPAGLKWNADNAKHVRRQLDKIIIDIESGTFSFAEVFPESKNKDHFSDLEHQLLERRKTPEQVLFKEHVWIWYNLRKASDGISARTLGVYKGYIEMYLVPFFGDKIFGSLNKIVFDEFVAWAKCRKYRDKPVDNESVKKYFVTLK